MSKKVIFVSIILILGILIFVSSKAYAISWEYNLTAALEEGKTSGKPLMVDFYTTWCGWCKKLDHDTYENKTVDELSKEFICVKVDADQHGDQAAKYGVRGYPTIVFLDYDGREIDTIVGYRGPADFASAMSGILKKAKRPQVKAETGDAPKKAEGPQLALKGIAFNPKKPSALINNTVVKVGDTIEGAKVVEITQEKVRLISGDKEIVLTME